MSVRSKVITAAAALAIVTGVGAAGTQTANAATPECGETCLSLYSAAFGTSQSPNFVLDVLNNVPRTGQPLILAPASGTNQGEDFIADTPEPVSTWVEAGLMSPGLDPLYGKLYATEIEYVPYGAPTGECVGLGADTSILAPVTLQPCGVSAHTLWIFDGATTQPGSLFALISGTTDSNFRQPISLTTLLPGLPLTTAALTSSLSPQAGHQRWGYDAGVLR
jgi:hypothetical protein